MKKTTAAIIVVLLIGAAAAAFYWADFHATTSESHSDSQLATFRSGQGLDGQPAPSPNREIAIYVPGNGDRAVALRQELVRQFQANPAFAGVVSLVTEPRQAGQPVLMVEVKEANLLWTAFYARCDAKVSAAYASDGDVTWRGKEPVVMPNGPEPTVRVTGTFQFSDDTRGLVSRVAYQKHIGQQIAVDVSKAVANSLSAHTGVAVGE